MHVGVYVVSHPCKQATATASRPVNAGDLPIAGSPYR